jgi:predicted metal-dependent HD superfamily phosphohydrolase
MWAALGVSAPDTHLYEQLLERYSGRGRHYHTRRHLDECFARVDEFPDPVDHRHEIELALWFHDAVYDAHRSDNEEQSAGWARREVSRLGVAADVIERVDTLILATKHAAMPSSTDAQVIVDADLAILGAPAERFDEYERQVRAEYAWVPGFLFRRKRREILHAFLERPSIFSTAYFRAKYEAAARQNLQRSIDARTRSGRSR